MIYKFSVTIVGLGGVGNCLAQALSAFARAPVSEHLMTSLTFMDGDVYEQKNIGRQAAAAKMVGCNKAEAWKSIYENYPAKMNDLEVFSFPMWVTESTVGCISRNHGGIDDSTAHIILSAVDNHPARLVMSRYAQDVMAKSTMNFALIQGGCGKNFMTADIYGKYKGVTVGQPIELRDSDVLNSKEGDRDAMSCEELANSPTGDQTYMENYLTASMMISLMFTYLVNPEALVRSRGDYMNIESHYCFFDKEPVKIEQDTEETAETAETETAETAETETAETAETETAETETA